MTSVDEDTANSNPPGGSRPLHFPCVRILFTIRVSVTHSGHGCCIGRLHAAEVGDDGVRANANLICVFSLGFTSEGDFWLPWRLGHGWEGGDVKIPV